MGQRGKWDPCSMNYYQRLQTMSGAQHVISCSSLIVKNWDNVLFNTM